jgi:hypothetical protein
LAPVTTATGLLLLSFNMTLALSVIASSVGLISAVIFWLAAVVLLIHFMKNDSRVSG